jgi:hypothetical protein
VPVADVVVAYLLLTSTGIFQAVQSMPSEAECKHVDEDVDSTDQATPKSHDMICYIEWHV